MFKVVVLLGRKDGLTRDEFRRWIVGTHAPLVTQLPALRRLVINLVGNEDVPYDGVSEVWFDTRESFDAAYDTEVGRSVTADSLEHLERRIRLQVEEHSVFSDAANSPGNSLGPATHLPDPAGSVDTDTARGRADVPADPTDSR